MGARDTIARGLGAKALGAIPNAITTRLKRQISRPGARRLTDRPWNAPPAYAASTLYEVGSRVVNASNIYGAIVGGTSGASSAPTGTGAAAIVDGGVTWCYVSPTYASDADAPTFSTSTSAPALGKFYRNAACTYSSGAATVVSNDSWFNRLGFYGTLDSGGIGGFGCKGMSGGAEFETDSLTVCIARANANGSYGAIIEVDGRMLVDGVITQASTSGTTFTTITFANRKPRRIAVRYPVTNSVTMNGVYCEATATIWAPAQRDGALKGLFVGDSFGVSGGYYGEGSHRGVAAHLFDELGIDSIFLDAQGGTGFAGGGGFHFGDATRTAYVTGFQPDIVVAMTSVNDGGQTQAALNAAQTAWLAAVRAATPRALIIMLGLMSRNASEGTIEGYTRQWCAASGDANLLFIPASGDAAGSWATGGGTTSTPTGVGNGDIYWAGDGTHPIQRGQDYLGRRAGKAIKAYCAGL